MDNELEEGQIVLCTVEKIIGTTVFVKIDGNGEGTITTSEISPGRIRNLRDYVFPGKKIVCKVLRIQGDKITLSFRRVKQNEKKELMEKISREKSFKAILKTVLKEDADNIIEKINEKYSIIDFFENINRDNKLIGRYIDKTNVDKILKILETKKDKVKEIKKSFRLSNNSSNGIAIVKEILMDSCRNNDCKISYISAGKYLLKIKGDDLKKIKNEINNSIISIEKQAKKRGCDFSVEKN